MLMRALVYEGHCGAPRTRLTNINSRPLSRLYAPIFGLVACAQTNMAEVDQGKADAKHTDGVLELTLPKRACGASKRLEVH